MRQFLMSWEKSGSCRIWILESTKTRLLAPRWFLQARHVYLVPALGVRLPSSCSSWMRELHNLICSSHDPRACPGPVLVRHPRLNQKEKKACGGDLFSRPKSMCAQFPSTKSGYPEAVVLRFAPLLWPGGKMGSSYSQLRGRLGIQAR
jgi:hypothetical protein